MCLVVMQLVMGRVENVDEFLLVGFVGLSLATLGLLSSSLHLAKPSNAWRAFSRFRTSWLSREAVFSLAYYPIILMLAYLVYRSDGVLNVWVNIVAVLSLLVAFATVVCTGMIYASLKPIRQWHNPLVTPLYLLFSFTSGVLAYNMMHLVINGHLSEPITIVIMVLLVATSFVKILYFKSIGRPDGSTIGTATGFSQAQVRLLDAGHNADTFLTKEFVFDAGAVKLLRLRWIMMVLAFMIPFALLVAARYLSVAPAVYIAMVSMYVGLLLERWLFFAEARHVVRLYHGDQRC